MEVAARLRRQARATNERRLLVLAGSPGATRERARTALETARVDPAATSYLGSEDWNYGERIDTAHADRLLGTTREAVVVDCHAECRPNTLGRAVGAVDGGGLLVFCTPPLAVWPDSRDGFDESLAVPPFDRGAVTGYFRRRLVDTLWAHPGIAIVDAGTGVVRRDGLIDQAPRRPRPDPTPPADPAFPTAAYGACLTADQIDAVSAFEGLRESGEALVIEADRGRGKSSAAGLGAASLAREGLDVLVTAPTFRSARELFARSGALLDAHGEYDATGRNPPRRIETESGVVRFADPAEAVSLPGDPDRVIVDEAAALPVDVLDSLLSAPGLAFTTTIHGYEGAGRGFSVRFREHLDASSFAVTDVALAEPIRYAPADPIEVWSFRALAFAAGPPADPLVVDARPENVQYRTLTSSDLLADERLLDQVFGLLVSAHYRTEPDDLARLLDAPNVSIHALLRQDHVVSVALLAREGDLPAAVRERIYEGGQVRGNMVPDLLTSQLRDEAAGETVGERVLRIATHHVARSRGLGSRLLAEIRARCDGDWLGVSYGATPDLVSFWRENGFHAVHLSTSRNDRSGEHSVLMIDPLSGAGRDLLDRHTDWFLRRLPATLSDPLSAVDPDVVRSVCRSIDGTPAPDLSDFEWRHAAGIDVGASVHETAPRSVRRLALCHLVAPEADLGAEQERLLVRKALQAADWKTVSTELGYASPSVCMRTLGEAVGPLVSAYGRDPATEERGRFE